MPPTEREAPAAISPEEARLRGVAWMLLLGGLAVILRVTLAPGSAQDRIPESFLCLLCGQGGLANILRNILLFVPLGVGLGVLLRHAERGWLGAVGLSVLIEVLQTQIPGRNPLLIDVLSNASGAGLGVLLGIGVCARVRNAPLGGWRSEGWRSGGARLFMDSRLWVGMALTALLATGWLLAPAPPPPPHFVQWTARLGHLEVYEGSLRDVRLEGRPLEAGRHLDPDFLTRNLLEGGLLELEVEAGPPPPGTAPILSIFNDRQEELFLLGASGENLVVHLPFRATRLRLERPDLAAGGALEGVAGGSGVQVAFRLHRTEACLAVEGEEFCEPRPSLGKGWALLLFSPALGPGLRRTLSALWLMVLAFPAAFFAPTTGRAMRNGTILAVAVVLIPFLPFLPLPAAPWGALAVLAGAAAGAGMGRWLGLQSGMPPAEPRVRLE